MKLLMIGGTVLALGALAIVFLPSAEDGPPPILRGRDACGFCRMQIGAPGFAGIARDARGDWLRYDDIGCMLLAMDADAALGRDAWVEKHPGASLVRLSDAVLVHAASVHTPMEHGLVAFGDAGAADAFAMSSGGRRITLGDGTAMLRARAAR